MSAVEAIAIGALVKQAAAAAAAIKKKTPRHRRT